MTTQPPTEEPNQPTTPNTLDNDATVWINCPDCGDPPGTLAWRDQDITCSRCNGTGLIDAATYT
jgi:hypothetical protein